MSAEDYAKVVWSPDDVTSVCPTMNNQQAKDFLHDNGGRIEDRMVEAGWEAIKTLLIMDGWTLQKEDE